jgi:hypothetical protein
MDDQIGRSSGDRDAESEADEFCRCWEAGLDGNELIAAVRVLSPLALEIVAERFRNGALQSERVAV